MPWTALAFLARDPGTVQPSRHGASPKPTVDIIRSLNLTEPMKTTQQREGHSGQVNARQRLSPFGPSHRPPPQPPATAMAQRSTQQPGTSNLSPSPHSSSSICDEDLHARGHTQACSSILFTCILTLFTQHLSILIPPTLPGPWEPVVACH